jgi:glutamine synthetase
MSKFRFRALEELLSRKAVEVVLPSNKPSDFYGINVFDKPKMKKYLSEDAYAHVIEAIETGSKIDRRVADQVAAGMKAWATERGASHYTHWFQPLTDGTAEKHDSFFSIDSKGQGFESFNGDLLAQQEPDASSFPNGGLRNTFEARGYTAWDPSSPAFVVGSTLCIPTIFVAYTGEALDFKTPLLKALSAVDKAAVDVCHYFDKNVKKVQANLGWEQEYFLVDEALYMARPDLLLTDRTLMGHASAKDQQLSDHYFGSIPARVEAFMADLEIECWKLGVPLKTRHNEVAPNQFECAPIFEECNLAVDHNILLMDVMRKVGRRHKLRVLLHEKPFKRINGSGKHNNWSLSTDTGVNLLKPGKNPKANLQFLTFLVNTVKTVFDNQDLLRASIFSAANAHRLGAHEAPPSIMSVFLGTQLTSMLDEIEASVPDRKMTPDEKTELKLNIGKIPEILLDNTDRNRTSPFAFTGNRFEFRAVGSSANCAMPMTALNSALAKQLREFKVEVDAKIEAGIKKDEAILQVLREYIIYSKAVRFDGNGYSAEWVEEAARRGLSNVRKATVAFQATMEEKFIKLFEELEVLTRGEIAARYEILQEKYTKKIQIEARVLGDLALNHIVPTALRYQSVLIENVKSLKEIFSGDELEQMAAGRIDTIRKISTYVNEIRTKVDEMVELRKVANNIEDVAEQAITYENTVFPYLDAIRTPIDHLERIVDDEFWPLPKYREMVSIR